MDAFLRKKRDRVKFQLQPFFLVVGLIAGVLVGVGQGYFVQGEVTVWHFVVGSVFGAILGTVLSSPSISSALREMPSTMKQLAVVQFFTWLGLFCMWMFFGLATSERIFGASDIHKELYEKGNAWANIGFAVYSIVCFLVALALPKLATVTSRRTTHAFALLCGAAGLLSVYFIHDRNVWLLTMVGIGVAWASILSLPYAMLSGALPAARMGVYMGIFNFFIVLPEIVASLTFQPLIKYVFHNNPLYVVMLGGVSMLLAAILTALVKEIPPIELRTLEQMAKADEPIMSAIPPEAPPISPK